MNTHPTRRSFLRNSSIAAAAALTSPLLAQVEHQLGAEESSSPTTQISKDTLFLRVLLTEADGSPLDKDRVKTLHARDLTGGTGDPLPQTIITAPGRARIELAKEPIQITVRLKVPNFGEVYCFADNEGAGYSKPATIDFVRDA